MISNPQLIAFPPMSIVYHALYLEDLTLGDLSEKIALLYSVTPQQISHIYRQGPTGIHILVSDEVREGRGQSSDEGYSVSKDYHLLFKHLVSSYIVCMHI